jgi:hypothetical protein
MDNWLRMYFMGLIKLTGLCPHWSLSNGDVQRYFFFGYSPCWLFPQIILGTLHVDCFHKLVGQQLGMEVDMQYHGDNITLRMALEMATISHWGWLWRWRQYHIEDGFGDGFVNGRLHCRKAHKLDELDEQHWANVVQPILHGAVSFKRQTLTTVVFRLLWGTTKLLGTPSMISWNRLWCIVMYIR